MRYNLVVPVQLYVEEGLLDGDGEPLARPLGTTELHLHTEADTMGEAMTKVSHAIQQVLNGYKGQQ